ncbi:MGMT family protein [Candidatus Formimonas warabiya]|uniref:MGMT family protein n=1 Tax=Formimonas warabiya TaxID=1761012 RepID=UPI001F013B46|nr:methylated-DNA--[protein]-cysteine S-methyltransferase [Candidatus Formimonas warabiya]
MKNFFARVYEIVGKIPEGKVATYGLIALLLGQPRNGRVVCWAMRAAPLEMHLPCHRVVNKTGTLAPDYVFGRKEIQRALLEREGITFTKDGKVDLARHLWDGNAGQDEWTKSRN